MKQYNQVCPVCGKEAYVGNCKIHQGIEVNCRQCGLFALFEKLFKQEDDNIYLPLKLKSCIYYYLTHMRNKNDGLLLHFHNIETWGKETKIEEGNHQYIHVDTMYNLYPHNLMEKMNMITVNLAHILKFVGNTINLNNLGEDISCFHLFFIDDTFVKCSEYGEMSITNQFTGLLHFLCSVDLLEEIEFTGDNCSDYSLSIHGWMTASEYLQKVMLPKQAFVAMWFDPSMKEAREQIIKAVNDSGYTASIIDMKEHNNQIVPEIFHEIKKSRFIVADMTGQRGGVYYEAGYAEGLELPVIVCCKDYDFTNTHFDIKQKNAIIWKDEEELYNKLRKRIESTVGEIK